MNERLSTGWFLASLTYVILLAGCAGGAGESPAPASPTPASLPSEAVATPILIATATVTPARTPSVVVTSNVAYESANEMLEPGTLDVYAPTRAGPWPVVVMFHGSPVGLTKESMSEPARRVADLGLVVFVPTWGQQGSGTGPYPSYDYARAFDAQAACAVAFAVAHATEYGGDPAGMIVFGFSAGANFAAMVPLAHPEPSPGCLAGVPLGAVETLVIYDGDWFPLDSSWDSMIAANPAILDAATPWRYLPDHRDLRVVMLGSELAGPYVRPLGDAAAADAFFAVRDPSGDRRRRLEALGALADNQVSIVEEQQLLFSVLAAQGNRVSLDFMPGATHDDGIRGAGWDIFLAAFEKALAND